MQADTLDRERLRRLAEFRADQGQVVSVYLDLTPAEFATPPARETEIRSLLDDANRQLRERDDLSHEEVASVKRDLERVGELLAGVPADGARALAIFCSSSGRDGDGLMEVLSLPRPAESRVALGRSPQIEPLSAIVAPEAWGIVLANRRVARIFRGSRDSLRELHRFEDDTHGQHDQGGWSQARYQRSVAKEANDHLRATAEAAFRRFRAAPIDRLLIGGPKELLAELRGLLRSSLRERVAGEIEVDVNNSNPDEVLAAARPVMQAKEREREDEALARLRADVGHGTGAAGLASVLAATNERRLEALLIDDGLAAPGRACPLCGSLWPASAERCLADDSELERRDNVVEIAVERTIAQSADVLVLKDRPDLGPHGGIAALLRF